MSSRPIMHMRQRRYRQFLAWGKDIDLRILNEWLEDSRVETTVDEIRRHDPEELAFIIAHDLFAEERKK